MIFKIHDVLMLEVLALVASTFLLMMAHKQECCQKFYKLIAFLGILISFGTLICTGYHIYKYAKSGIIEMHGPGMMKMGMGGMGMRMEEMGSPKNPIAESAPSHGCMP